MINHRLLIILSGLLLLLYGQFTLGDKIENSQPLSSIYSLLLEANMPGDALPRPAYLDAANIPELAANEIGAMGLYPVRKISLPNPWPAYTADAALSVDLYYPAGLNGKRPTVFFISGWHQYDSDRYRSLMYFIASQGYNCIFIPYKDVDPMGDATLLTSMLDSVVAGPWNQQIDTTKIGFAGHSMGAGLIYYLAQARINWGTQGRFLFSIAAWWGFHLPATGNISFPPNTHLIVQQSEDDPGTDPRQNIDFFLHNSISDTQKSYLYVPGDADHISDHGLAYSEVINDIYYYDALEQIGLHRPLESLMNTAFGVGQQDKSAGLPDAVDDNYNLLYAVNSISVLSTDTPMANHGVPIPAEADLTHNFLCSNSKNPRSQMCMPCGDTSRDLPWQQCP